MYFNLSKVKNPSNIRLVCLIFLLNILIIDVHSDVAFRNLGSEFNISNKLVGDQLGAKTVLGSNGGISVWQDNSTDSYGLGIAAQYLDVNGNPVNSPFKVNSLVDGNQENASVGIHESGAYFVWEGGASGFHRVFFRIINDEGVFLSEDAFITSSDSGEQIEPSVTVLNNGNAVISWTDYLLDGSNKGISALIINQKGKRVSEEIRINNFTFGNQHKCELVSMPDGGFAAVWVSDQQFEKKSIDIIGRIFSNKGNPLTGELKFSTNGINTNPDVSILNDSALVVTWEQLDSENPDSRWDIGFSSYNFDLGFMSKPVLANTHLKGDQFKPQIEANQESGLLVWSSLGQDKSREAIIGRFINKDGLLSGEEIIINTKQSLSQISPSVTSSSENSYLVTWSTPSIGVSGFDVVGQKYNKIDSDVKLPPISKLYVNPISDTELLISWPKVEIEKLSHYNIYKDGLNTPKKFNNNFVLWSGLRPGSEYAFRVEYVTEDNGKSIISDYSVNKTWGRDYNGDGLPDDWQAKYFGENLKNWEGANSDYDNDGVNNLNEFLAGTDPNNKNDKLILEIKKLEIGKRLEWNAVKGAVYQLQKTSEITGNWQNIFEPIIALENRTGISLQFVDDLSFYRIQKIK